MTGQPAARFELTQSDNGLSHLDVASICRTECADREIKKYATIGDMGVSDLNADMILDNMSDLIFVMILDDSNTFRYVKMNSSAMSVSGLTASAYGATFYDVLDINEARFLDEQYHRALVHDEPVSFILNHAGQVGETKLNKIKTGSSYFILGTVRDITERAGREQRLRKEAQFDALTGLMNRYGLQERLGPSMAEAGRNGTLVAMMVIDIDSLKATNDTWGHLTGDAVLQEAARRIQGVIRKHDIVARIGGDEFVLAANVETKSEGILLAERLRRALSPPWLHNDISMEMSASMGIAMFPLHGTTITEVIHQADKALYRAKLQPGNHYECAD